MPRVDAIGGSSAGVYVDDRPRVASLFRGIPKDRFGEVRTLFLRLREAMGVPLEVVNDGEVTALAGSMSLEDDAVLGMALGSSEAGGYVDAEGNITDWLNELAFARSTTSRTPRPTSGPATAACGAQYFSQQCVFRLAPRAGIAIPDGARARREAEARAGAARGRPRGRAPDLGDDRRLHGLRHRPLRRLLRAQARADPRPLHLRQRRPADPRRRARGARGEFPEHPQAASNIQLPDEKSRRVGQSIAAASLPALAAAR